MVKDHQGAIVVAAAVVCATLLMSPVPVMSQPASATGAGEDVDAAKAERIARRFEARALVLTVFDRQGHVVTTVGERGLYQNLMFSPDGTRLAVRKLDLETDTNDLWVIDIATGHGTRITSHDTWDLEWAVTPVWSPDGSELAYIAMRDGYEGVYRKASNGEGPEVLLYRHPGAGMGLRDWSMDGRYLSMSANDDFGGTLYVLPMLGDRERTPIEVVQSDSPLMGGSFSPDGRFLSYMSEDSGRPEVYVRPFDPSGGGGAASGVERWQVSDHGGRFPVRAGWRQDGRELYYVATNGGIVAAEVNADSTFTRGQPTQLFRLSQAIRVIPRTITVSRDGERFVIGVPHAPTLEQVTVFDRQGSVLQRVGEPGIYRNPTLSPDGMKVAVMRVVPETGDADIWTFDLTSGTGTPVTNDQADDNWPVWSPDGGQVAYRSERGIFSRIYRKAWDGTGEEEQLFEYTPGAFLQVTDWSADGRFVTFQDGCWGVLHVVPLSGGQDGREQRVIEWLRDEYQVAQARFSPDSRFIAYLSDETEADVFQLYVGPFDADQPNGGWDRAAAVQVSSGDVLGAVSWREDGEELYYLTHDWEMMAVDVTTTPTFQAGTTRLLFTLPAPVPGNPKQWKSVSPDGQRFVFTTTVPVSVSAR